jgi:KaiC/GvpD/RAD55 family RecA-like ATPase
MGELAGVDQELLVMREELGIPQSAARPRVDPAIAPILARLAQINGPDDLRPEADRLDDLDACVDEIVQIVGGWKSKERASEIEAEISRLQEAALVRPEGLGALRERIAERRKVLGIGSLRAFEDAAQRVLGRVGSPPLQHVATGLATLDQITRGGLLARRLHLIAGEPDAGKTALLVQIALYAAQVLGWVVALHSIDEPRQWIEDRIGQAIGLSLEDLEGNDPVALATLTKFMQDTPNLKLVGREDKFTAEDTAEAAEALRKRLGAPGVFLGYDSLQKIRTRAAPPKGTRVDPRELLELTVDVLLDLALTGPIVVATSEIPRSAYRARGAKDRTPEMAAAKGVGSAEYAVTTQIVLSQIDKGERAGCVRAGVPKNKRGEKRVAFALERDLDRCTFTDRGRVEGEDGAPEELQRPKAAAKALDERLVEKARLELAKRPQGIAGGLDGWASLLGAKLVRARLACQHLLATGEAESLNDAGRKVFRLKGGVAVVVPEQRVSPADES